MSETRLLLSYKDVVTFSYLRKMGWISVNEHSFIFNKEDGSFTLRAQNERTDRNYTIHKWIDDDGDEHKVKLTVKQSGISKNGVFSRPKTIFSMHSLIVKKLTNRRLDSYVKAMVQIASERITRLVCTEYGYPDIRYTIL